MEFFYIYRSVLIQTYWRKMQFYVPVYMAFVNLKDPVALSRWVPWGIGRVGRDKNYYSRNSKRNGKLLLLFLKKSFESQA